MTKNVTLRLDEKLLRRCRRAAGEKDKSLSRWIADLLIERTGENAPARRARTRILQRLEKGFPLGGRPLPRGDIYGGR
jgi:hypothetical protein